MSTSIDPVRHLMAAANPAPNDAEPPPEILAASVLLDVIDERSGEMTHSTQTRPTPSPAPPPPRPWYRSPAVVFLIAIAAVMVVAVPLVLFTGGGSEVTETPATTAPAPAPEVSTTLPPTTVPATTVPATTLPLLGTPFVWSAVDLDPDQFIENESQIWGIAHTGSHFVAVGRGTSDCAQVWVSPDGAAWNGAPAAGGGLETPCGAVIQDVASNDDVLVAVGREGAEAFGLGGTATMWVSADGLSWDHVVLSGTPFVEGDEILTVAGSEKGFVVAGSDIWFSPDGRTWSKATAPPVETVVDVSAGPGGFFAVGYLPGGVAIFDQQGWQSANAVLHSPDGQTWSVVAELEGIFQEGTECWVGANAVTHGPHGYVIAGDCVSEDANVAYSSMWMSEDGLSWSQVPYDEAAFGEPAYITSITADDSGYLAAGWTLGETDPATVWTSDDGSSWTRSELTGLADSDFAIYSVAVHDGTALAVGLIDFRPAIWLGTRP